MLGGVSVGRTSAVTAGVRIVHTHTPHPAHMRPLTACSSILLFQRYVDGAVNGRSLFPTLPTQTRLSCLRDAFVVNAVKALEGSADGVDGASHVAVVASNDDCSLAHMIFATVTSCFHATCCHAARAGCHVMSTHTHLRFRSDPCGC